MATGHVARVFPGLVFFLPDGQLLVPDSRGPLPTLTFWDGPLGPRLRVVQLPWLQAIGALSMSPDGQYIAFGLADGTVRFWNVGTAQEVAQLDLKAALEVGPEAEFRLADASFNPDGDLLLTVVWTPSVGKLQVHLWHVGDLLGGASAQP
jgi:WD40 repeat protein